MKKYIFTLVAIGLGMTVQAQPASLFFKHLSPQQRKHQKMIKRLLMQQNGHSALGKATTVRQRVIAQTYIEDGEVDSTSFKYSGNRTSRFDYNNMEDLMYRDYFDDYYYAGDYLTGQASDMQADSISYYYDTDGDQIADLSDQSTAHYRSDNQMQEMHYLSYSSGVVNYEEKYTRIYNSQGYLTEIYGLGSANSMPQDTTGYQKLYYNNDFSKVLSDTMWNRTNGVFMLDEATQYLYDNDQLTEIKSFDYAPNSGLFVPDENTLIRYYNDGKVRSVSVYDASGLPALELESRDSFIYTTGVDYFTEWYEDSWFTGDYEYGIHMVQYPGANGLPDSLKAYSREDADSAFVPDGRLYYTYNSYNNPVQQRILFSDTSSDSIMVHFYYEEYDDGLSIGTVADHNSLLSVYPNPFTDHITINWKDAALKQADLALFDNLGRMVFHRTVRMAKGVNTIELPDLPAGMYLLKLKNQAGMQWRSKVVKK